MSLPEIITPNYNTIEEWDAAIKAEGLHIKWKEQIEEIRVKHAEKKVKIQETFDEWVNNPEYYKKILSDGNPELSTVEIDAMYQEHLEMFNAKIQKLTTVVRCAEVESEIRQDREKKLGPENTPAQYKRDFPNYEPTVKVIDPELPEVIERNLKG